MIDGSEHVGDHETLVEVFSMHQGPEWIHVYTCTVCGAAVMLTDTKGAGWVDGREAHVRWHEEHP